MHKVLSSRWIGNALGIGERHLSQHGPPIYLCPALGRSLVARRLEATARPLSQPPWRRCLHSSAIETQQPALEFSDNLPARQLPLQCTGCGAFSQTKDPGVAGYFGLERKAVRRFLGQETPSRQKSAAGIDQEAKDDLAVRNALNSLSPEQLEKLGLEPEELTLSANAVELQERAPLCDRCHDLVYYHKGTPIYHPSIESLRDTIQESPYKHNHIYHVLDAADFPMSLIPRLHLLLGDVTLRSRNRRSRHDRYYKDRKTDMSFIITRADLLAPTKEQVDSLMPWLREVLREALGRVGKMVRLGNVRCVSARRSWWTKSLKEEIWERGGGGWMVGKVNVGKSQLFEAVFPKGRMGSVPPKHSIGVDVFPQGQDDLLLEMARQEAADESAEDYIAKEEQVDDFAMLPPAQPESNYPAMPTVSSLPGTTASPIRIPFGNGKGELIDLPGLTRSDLELFVSDEYRQSLVMKNRIKPQQQVLKPGQSLLIGGLIRITPQTPDLVFLAYNFTPLKGHLTSTAKAVEFQEQAREDQALAVVGSIALPGTGDKMQHAGSFQLRHDVTKERAGPLTRKDGIKLKVENLPFRVCSVDILIEGCGWVELVAQVRAKDLYENQAQSKVAKELPAEQSVLKTNESNDAWEDMEHVANGTDKTAEAVVPEELGLNWPVVDVYSPEGRFVDERIPMGSWMLNKPRVLEKHLKKRPRKSMKGEKKKAKLAKRAAVAQAAGSD